MTLRMNLRNLEYQKCPLKSPKESRRKKRRKRILPKKMSMSLTKAFKTNQLRINLLKLMLMKMSMSLIKAFKTNQPRINLMKSKNNYLKKFNKTIQVQTKNQRKFLQNRSVQFVSNRGPELSFFCLAVTHHFARNVRLFLCEIEDKNSRKCPTC